MSPELQTIINVVGFISIPFGAYLGVKVALAELRGETKELRAEVKRIDERDEAQDKRMDKQDERMNRLEDRLVQR